jgi:RimJ/RimL family protein N-acetyltransferase
MSDPAKYETFISGETIDLVIPNEKAIEEDGWHTWFNNPMTTRYLKYGAFPNTKDHQRSRLKSAIENQGNSLILMVLPKKSNRVTGITHISGIDLNARAGHIGIVMDSKNRSAGDIFQSLETKARMTEHGFEKIGLERIWGAQVIELEVWQRYQVLLGYKPEGITKKSFRKGMNYHDEVLTSCLLEDYLKLREARNGSYWPGRKTMMELMRSVPRVSLVEKVSDAIQGSIEEYMKNINLF